MDPCYNLTNLPEPMDFHLQVLVGSFLTILIVFTLCGNVVVCLAVTFDRRLRSLTNCIIVSLAITDLLLSLLVLPFSAFYELTHKWPFGSFLCNIYISLDVMLCTASILNLFMISLDRYFAVTTPLRYSQMVTLPRVTVGLVIIWVVSLMVSFLPIHLGWNTNGTAVQNTASDCSKECKLEVNPMYGLVDALLTFYIPLVIMCITYYRIFKIAREQAKRINHTWSCSGNTPMPPIVKEHKATVTLAVVLGAFVVCWFPYFTVFIYRGMWGDSSVKGTPMSIVLWLGYANSALNPILYGTLNRDFRMAYKHLLHCWKTGGPRACLPALRKAQPRSARQGRGGKEGKPLRLEMRNGTGILLADRALKRIPSTAHSAGSVLEHLEKPLPAQASSLQGCVLEEPLVELQKSFPHCPQGCDTHGITEHTPAHGPQAVPKEPGPRTRAGLSAPLSRGWEKSVGWIGKKRGLEHRQPGEKSPLPIIALPEGCMAGQGSSHRGKTGHHSSPMSSIPLPTRQPHGIILGSPSSMNLLCTYELCTVGRWEPHRGTGPGTLRPALLAPCKNKVLVH